MFHSCPHGSGTCESSKCVPMGFTRNRFPAGTHMCLLYESEKQRRRIVSKYIESGLLAGEQVGYFADTATPGDIQEWLDELGVDFSSVQATGQLQISSTDRTYFPKGEFIVDDMLDRLRCFYRESSRNGSAGVRVSGEMSWALRGVAGSEHLIEYEALVNNVLETHPITAICQYDATRFDGATILNVLKVHPMMIVRGQVVRNPYYMQPEAFLNRFHAVGNAHD